jgi:peptidoglycan/LPS O-acetylase OafA/YrhL
LQRIPEFDSLRGIASCGVILTHFWRQPLHLFWGWTLLEFFFVLSGYLITTILLEGKGNLKFVRNFYVRRTLRVWPLYFVSLLAVLGACGAMGCGFETEGRPSGIPLYFFFLQFTDFYVAPENGVFAYVPIFWHSWSLAVEEQFYLIWPLTFLIFRPRFGTAMLFIIPLFVAGYLARYYGYNPAILLTRIDGLLLGIILAYVRRHFELNPQQNRRPWRFLLWCTILVGALALVPYMVSGWNLPFENANVDRSSPVLLFSLIFFGMVGLVGEFSGHRWMAWLRHKLLVLLGNMSYSLYMFHLPVVFFLGRALNEQFPVLRGQPTLFICLAVVFVLSYCSWTFLEHPIMRIKKQKFSYKT